MSFNAGFRISELRVCERGSLSLIRTATLRGNRPWKQQARSPSCTLGLQSPCSSTGCFLPSLLKNQVWSFVLQPTFKGNAAAAMVVTLHAGRNEQNFPKKKAGLVLTALPTSVACPDMGVTLCTFEECCIKGVTNFVKKHLHFFKKLLC